MISPISFNNISFRAHTGTEFINSKHSDYLCHTTEFFRYNNNRYRNTDSFMMEQLEKSQKDKPLNIVSIGCSYGEEVYSYAMGLNHLNPKPKIIGFDPSQSAIDGAKEGIYTLNDNEQWYLTKKNTYYDDGIRNQVRPVFHDNFECIDKDTKTYKLKEGRFENCEFFVGEIQEIGKYFPANSQDCLLCRYVLYHCRMQEVTNPNVYKKIYTQMFDILKPGGLLCLNRDEYEYYNNELLDVGFIQPYETKPWIYQKPTGISNTILSHFRQKFNK
ncbi:methyltransferase domain-containing protein [bacterium]|nr:methyltransferase domain-containing protein [bacterium]